MRKILLYRQKSQHGFTMIELLTVFFIIGVIAAIIIPNIRKAFYRAQLSGCQSNLRNIATALQIYHADNQDYPDNLEVLAPKYMPKMPQCPTAGRDTYSKGYAVSKNPPQYTISCHGNNHTLTGLKENEPFYTLDSGLGP